MKTTHTPGPWNTQRGIVDYHIWPIGWHKSGSYDKSINFSEEDHANARLIAAAPELLEMCKTIRAYLNTTDATHDRNGTYIDNTLLRVAVLNVINKAEGGGE
jgi:hypothetical protein